MLTNPDSSKMLNKKQ
jgi:hypothetical protein